MGLDDGFGVDTNDEPSNENNMRLVLSLIGVSGSESKFEDDEYESEELGSSDPDASDEERGVRYEKFRKDQMGKKYKFKFGMEFSSLQDFRDAIRDHNVRNGYQVRWKKNEGNRVRVVCDRGGHNASSCKSKVQDPNGLKRKRKPPKAKAPDEAKSGAIPKSDANPSTEANASQQPNSATVEVSQVDNPTQNSASVQADHSANVQADQLGHQRSHQIIYLAMKDAFSIIQETTNREFLLRVSYLEIYNEVCFFLIRSNV
ncbi:hypothetical protein QL285_003659 [Trifolium repens]|nr:hypothetical protein QL285_003659 [Trifolium repens]